ncbi:hypothetical protein NUW54_g11612 [Trametes sanguinea]|uniref:Uncharacterized protein n=1 Tax=Trametes sanguinea TaxID=158606 RepID=A0ACC1NB22_9APHY|nr:hypothetical protein NUW54_g11612 [Trametes sanguinea]
MMARRSRTVGRLGAFAVVLFLHSHFAWLVARADTPDGTNPCAKTGFWTVNSKGQTPCNVSTIFLQQCSGEGSMPSAMLTYTTHLSSPLAEPRTSCFCNTVAYSLDFACNICNGTDASQLGIQYPLSPDASTYFSAKNCTVPNGNPPSLPPGVTVTGIPSWAYLSLNNDVFDWRKAQQIAQSSSGPGGSSSSTPPSQNPPALSMSHPTSLPASPNNPAEPLAVNALSSTTGASSTTSTPGSPPSGASSVANHTDPAANGASSSAIPGGSRAPTPMPHAAPAPAA